MRIILAILQIVTMILRRIFSKRAKLKTATEQLPETSPTADAREQAEVAADAKFGPPKLVVVKGEESASPKE